MLDKSKSSVQDTKSTRNRTSVFTTELNKRVHESKQCTYSVFVYPVPSARVSTTRALVRCSNLAHRTEGSVGQHFRTELTERLSVEPEIQCSN